MHAIDNINSKYAGYRNQDLKRTCKMRQQRLTPR